ncbi:2-phosphosulfolactate phosphatase [bacterium]|nr:MAG: 2-phosphosulfolactate phosphatase [bacterium]
MIVWVSLVPTSVELFPKNHFDVAVVIDVLRATTTLNFALNAGASEIIPAGSVEEAHNLAEKYPDALLCGERNGIKVPGFHLGNSPSEYTPQSVAGKTLIFSSTNGSVMIKRAESMAKNVFLCSLRNVSAVAEKIYSLKPENILVACSGREGFFSIEDGYCAGMLYEKLEELDEDTTGANDSATITYLLVNYFGYDVDKIFHESIHARYLTNDLGLWKDIEDAGQIDADKIVPILMEGKIVA